MTLTELEQLIKSNTWTYLNSGFFNTVWVSDEQITIDGYTSRWVMKKPKIDEEMDELLIENELSIESHQKM